MWSAARERGLPSVTPLPAQVYAETALAVLGALAGLILMVDAPMPLRFAPSSNRCVRACVRAYTRLATQRERGVTPRARAQDVRHGARAAGLCPIR